MYLQFYSNFLLPHFDDDGEIWWWFMKNKNVYILRVWTAPPASVRWINGKCLKTLKKRWVYIKLRGHRQFLKPCNAFSVVGIFLHAQYFVLIHEEVLSPMITDINLKNWTDGTIIIELSKYQNSSYNSFNYSVSVKMCQ